MSRRRAMMANPEKPWFDTGFTLEGFTAGTNAAITYNTLAKTLRIQSTSNGTYRYAYKALNFTPVLGCQYLVEYDVTVTSGIHRGGLCDGSTLRSPNSGNVTSSEHVSFVWTYQSTQWPVDNFKFYCTWSTSQAGDCTISNFSIKRRLI